MKTYVFISAQKINSGFLAKFLENKKEDESYIQFLLDKIDYKTDWTNFFNRASIKNIEAIMVDDPILALNLITEYNVGCFDGDKIVYFKRIWQIE